MRSLVVPFLLAFAAPAHAATVGFESVRVGSDRYASTETVLRVAGEPGEASDLTLTASGKSEIVVSDARSPLKAGDGCSNVDERTVRCVAQYIAWPEIALGDGDDRARAGPGYDGLFNVDGGEGDDVLVGGDGRDHLRGGPGADRLEGRGEFDELDPGAGADVAIGGEGYDRVAAAHDEQVADDPDIIDAEQVSYGPRRTPLRADLQTGIAGADRLSGVSELWGGSARDVLRAPEAGATLWGSTDLEAAAGDVLIGRGGNDTLRGGAGRDVLRGGGGNDTLNGFRGADRYEGGPGDDHVELSRYTRTTPAALRCGPGRDLLTAALRIPSPAGCEGRDLTGAIVWLERRAGAVHAVSLARPWDRMRRWCRAEVTLRTAKGLLTAGFVGAHPVDAVRRRDLPRRIRPRAVSFRRSHRCRGPLPGKGDPPGIRWLVRR